MFRCEHHINHICCIEARSDPRLFGQYSRFTLSFYVHNSPACGSQVNPRSQSRAQYDDHQKDRIGSPRNSDTILHAVRQLCQRAAEAMSCGGTTHTSVAGGGSNQRDRGRCTNTCSDFMTVSGLQYKDGHSDAGTTLEVGCEGQ